MHKLKINKNSISFFKGEQLLFEFKTEDTEFELDSSKWGISDYDGLAGSLITHAGLGADPGPAAAILTIRRRKQDIFKIGELQFDITGKPREEIKLPITDLEALREILTDAVRGCCYCKHTESGSVILQRLRFESEKGGAAGIYHPRKSREGKNHKLLTQIMCSPHSRTDTPRLGVEDEIAAEWICPSCGREYFALNKADDFSDVKRGDAGCSSEDCSGNPDCEETDDPKTWWKAQNFTQPNDSAKISAAEEENGENKR